MVEIQDIEYLSTSEVAARYDVAYQTVNRWCREGLLGDVIDRGERRRVRYLIPAAALEGFEPPSQNEGGWPAGRKRK